MTRPRRVFSRNFVLLLIALAIIYAGVWLLLKAALDLNGTLYDVLPWVLLGLIVGPLAVSRGNSVQRSNKNNRA